MWQFFSGLFGALNEIFRHLREQKIRDSAKAEKTVEDLKVLEERKSDAERVDRVSDPSRDERLRRRFDRGE